MNNYTKILIYRMAGLTGTELSAEHLKILEYVADYYESNSVGPLYQNIKKNTGYTKKEIEALFPYALNSVYTWVGIPIHSTNHICKPAAGVQADDYREVYLDHNATTYLRDEIKSILIRHVKQENSYGNPSSSTDLGKQAYGIVQTARTRISGCLKVSPKEVLFVSGASEANNMAIKGIAFQHLESKGHIITSSTEHSSVLKTVRFLETLGFRATYLTPSKGGVIAAEQVRKHLCPDTILVSIMAVNNEIGTINPIAAIGKICREAQVPLMVDAAQGFGKIRIHPKAMGISLLSITGHKIYAPKGVGVLFVDQDLALIPLIHGGEQEFEMRAGTENLSSILSLGRAAQLICRDMDRENSRFKSLQQYFLERIKSIEPNIVINGSLEQRVPSNLNLGFPAVDSGALLLSLNEIGVFVSSGSACSAGSKESSHVLKALNVDTEHYGSIRFSFGLKTTKDDLDYLFHYLPKILTALKEPKEN